jgi:hypothetical protein
MTLRPSMPGGRDESQALQVATEAFGMGGEYLVSMALALIVALVAAGLRASPVPVALAADGEVICL